MIYRNKKVALNCKVTITCFISLLACFCCSKTLAQTYSPEQGSIVYFSPVSTEGKKQAYGYDCFYDPNVAIKKGSFIFNKKSRYNSNSLGYTPFEDIEGKEFYVSKTERVIVKNREYLVIHLLLDNEKPIILAIPRTSSDEDNILTKQMVNSSKSIVGNNNPLLSTVYEIVPCIPKLIYESAKQLKNNIYVQGKNISSKTECHYSSNSSTLTLREYLNAKIRDINSNANTDLNKAGFIGIKDIKWIDCPGSVFQKLCADCDFGNENHEYMPIFDYVFNDAAYYFGDYFLDREAYTKTLLVGRVGETISKYVGNKVYYGLRQKGGLVDFFYQNDMKPFKPEIGYYKCKGYNSFSISATIEILIEMEDSLGNTFLSKVKDENPVRSVNKYFEDYFVLEDEARKYFNQKELTKQKSEDLYKQWIKKYGSTIATYLNENPKDAEKFEKYAKQYDIKTAFDIVNGEVKIGWDTQKCRASWGIPLKKNISEYNWGTREQWCYENGYLYFDNGKLSAVHSR